jgi:hypothetical protein
MRTETITFQEVTLRGQKSVKCAGGCGRTLKRQQKFWQTLSPFNKTTAGFVKTAADIRTELESERAKWMLQFRLSFASIARRERGSDGNNN